MNSSQNLVRNAGIGIGIFFSILIITAFIYQKNRTDHANEAMIDSKNLLFYSQDLFGNIREIETSTRAYLIAKQSYFLENFKINKKETFDNFRLLIIKANVDEQLQKSIQLLQNIVLQRLKFCDSAIGLKNKDQLTSNIITLFSGSVSYFNQITLLATEIENIENKLLEDRLRAEKRANLIENIILISGILCMLFLMILLLKTQRTIGENEVKKKEDSIFQGLLEAAPDAMVIINEKREIVLINQQTQNMFGYTKENLIDESVEILVLENFSHNNNRYKNNSSKHIPSWLITGEHELMAVKKNGLKFPVEINLSPFQTDKGLLVFASVRDISERKKAAASLKKSEKNFELMVNSVKDYAIFLVDKNGYVASWNIGAERIKGYTSKEIIGKPISIFYNEEDILKGEPQNNLNKALREGHYETQGWRIRKNGNSFCASVVITALYDDDGKFSGYAKVTKDITEKFKDEEQIRFLATIANNIQDPIISTDGNFCITSWSAAAEKLFEWNKMEAIGKTITELLLVEYLLHDRNQIIKHLNQIGFWQGEVIYKSKSGRFIQALPTVSTLKDAKGNAVGNLLLIRDITQQKITDKALQKLNTALEERVKERTAEVYKNEKKYRALIENNYDVISLLDKKLNIIYRSPSAFRVTGYDNNELDTIYSVKNLHPDDVAAAEIKIKQVFDNPFKTVSTLFRNKHKNGTYLWIEGTMTNLLKDKNVEAIVLNYRDVTERVEGVAKLIDSEKLYRNLFENILHGFAYCHAIFINEILQDYSFLTVNKEYETLMELENITGKKISQLLPGLLLADIEYAAALTEVLKSGQPDKIETYYKPLKKWFSISMYSSGKNNFVCLMDNITDRKETEERIFKINEELEEKVIYRTGQLKKTNEELEAFSYSISHDLRAPLRGIIGFTTILEEDYVDKLDTEAKRLLSIIKNNTVKMGKLIDDLLSFSRLNRQQIIKTSINLNTLLDGLVAGFNNNVKNPIQWKIASLPSIKGDAATIEQVWINLLSNAIKYSRKKDHPTIEIGWKQTSTEEVFFVKDNGVGFDLKYKTKLFKVFQRLHSEAEFEGTGIGLAIIEKIITKHGGSVWADAAIDEGACFYFSIPR